MIVQFGQQDYFFPDDTPEDQIAAQLDGMGGQRGGNGFMNTMGQMAQAAFQNGTPFGGMQSTIPALSNASFLTPQQTFQSLGMQQRSQENDVAQKIEQRQQQERRIEAEKDRAQQIKLQNQQMQNRIKEIEIQNKQKEAEMKLGKKLDLEFDQQSGNAAYKEALTRESNARAMEAGMPPAPQPPTIKNFSDGSTRQWDQASQQWITLSNKPTPEPKPQAPVIRDFSDGTTREYDEQTGTWTVLSKKPEQPQKPLGEMDNAQINATAWKLAMQDADWDNLSVEQQAQRVQQKREMLIRPSQYPIITAPDGTHVEIVD